MSSAGAPAGAASPAAARAAPGKRPPLPKARVSAAKSPPSSQLSSSRSSLPSTRRADKKRRAEKKREAAKARTKELQEAAAVAAATAAAMRVRASEARAAKERHDKLERLESIKEQVSPRAKGASREAGSPSSDLGEPSDLKPQLYYLYQQQAYASAAMLFGRQRAQQLYSLADSGAELLLVPAKELRDRAAALQERERTLRAVSDGKVSAAASTSSVSLKYIAAVIFGDKLASYASEQGVSVQALFQRAHREASAAGLKNVRGGGKGAPGGDAEEPVASMTMPEFRVAIQAMRVATIQDEEAGVIEDLFRMMDSDGSGDLDLEELEEGLKKMRAQRKEAEKHRASAAADVAEADFWLTRAAALEGVADATERAEAVEKELSGLTDQSSLEQRVGMLMMTRDIVSLVS